MELLISHWSYQYPISFEVNRHTGDGIAWIQTLARWILEHGPQKILIKTVQSGAF